MRTGQIARCWAGSPLGKFAAALLALVALSLTLLGLAAAPARADTPGLDWSISIDGRNLDTVTRNDPLSIGISDSARVQLDLNNTSQQEVLIRSVRIEGRVIGMAFFSFTTRLDIVLPPGQQTQRRFDIDISDLGQQATGLLPATVILLAPNRDVVDQHSFAVNVDGSVASIYGAFGLVMAGITAVVLAGLLYAVSKGRLPTNRWQRGARFLAAGVGIGLVLTFSLSATRLLVPSARWWLPILLLCGAGAFLIGYFLPMGAGQDLDESDPATDEADSDLAAGDSQSADDRGIQDQLGLK